MRPHRSAALRATAALLTVATTALFLFNLRLFTRGYRLRA